MRFPSFAKINLGLRVLGKRADGFHEIETIFQTISLKDTLDIETTNGGIEFSCLADTCPGNQSNIVYKAAALLQQQGNISSGCKIVLDKIIPVGAGLGGGSSNAAAALKALNKLWGLNLGDSELCVIAGMLGSDVPFFIYGGIAAGTGRGEILTRLDVNTDFYGILVCPKIQILSKWAYQNLNFSLTKSYKKSKLSVFTRMISEPASWKNHLENDFEKAVFRFYPELAKIKNTLDDLGAFYSRMSGSGSTIFGLFTTEKAAKHALIKMQATYRTEFFRPVFSIDQEQ